MWIDLSNEGDCGDEVKLSQMNNENKNNNNTLADQDDKNVTYTIENANTKMPLNSSSLQHQTDTNIPIDPLPDLPYSTKVPTPTISVHQAGLANTNDNEVKSFTTSIHKKPTTTFMHTLRKLICFNER